MAALILLGLAIGIDNFYAGASLSTLGLPADKRRRLAIGFGLFEALMPLAGLMLGRELAAQLALPWLEQALLVALGLALLAGIPRGGALARRLGRSPWLLVLPLLLSFDNLLAGSALGAIGLPRASLAMAGAGLLSAMLAWLGLLVGDRATLRAPKATRLAAGAGLLVVALLDVI
jgi:putative Mn2+ efflux pump MntP